MRACRWAGGVLVLRVLALRVLAGVLPLLIPASLLGGGTSTAGRFGAIAAVTALTVVVIALVLAGVLPFQRPYLWIALLAVLLLVSFRYPQVTTPVSLPPERHRIVELLGVLGVLGELDPVRLSRLTDLAGLLAGLALLGTSIALARRPVSVARVIALTGTAAAGYVIVRGGYAGGRLEGLGCNSNYLGILLVLPLVAAVALMRHTRGPRWLLPAAVCFVALIDTQSRGAFLAAAAGVACALLQGRSRRWQALAVLAAAAVGLAAAVTGRLAAIGGLLTSLGAGDRTAGDLSLNNGVRGQVAELAVRVITEHPLRGIGYWMFPAYAERVPGFGQYLTTHNEYLRLGAEAGLPALAVFLVLLWRGAGPRRTGELAVPRAVVVAYGVALLFANPLASLVVSAPFWVSLGCLLARARDEKATGAEPAMAEVPEISEGLEKPEVCDVPQLT